MAHHRCKVILRPLQTFAAFFRKRSAVIRFIGSLPTTDLILLRPLSRRSLAKLDAAEAEKVLLFPSSEGGRTALVRFTEAQFQLIVMLLVNPQERSNLVSVSSPAFVPEAMHYEKVVWPV